MNQLMSFSAVAAPALLALKQTQTFQERHGQFVHQTKDEHIGLFMVFWYLNTPTEVSRMTYLES